MDYRDNHTIHAPPQFLNAFDWQRRRLSILIEALENLAVSTRDFHEALSLLLREGYIRRQPAWGVRPSVWFLGRPHALLPSSYIPNLLVDSTTKL